MTLWVDQCHVTTYAPLDRTGHARAIRCSMMRIAPLSVAAALLVLSACGKPEPEIVDTNPDPMANQIANAAPVELPPAVTDSAIYRCKDNSVVYVDFLGDKMMANVRTEKGGAPTQVKAEAAGQPLAGEGTSVSGSGGTVQIAVKGGAAQSCSR